METTRYLSMKFIASSDGSSRTIRLADPKAGITAAEVQAVMDEAVSGQLLYTSKGQLCDTVDSASVVDRNTEELFNIVQ